MHHSAERLDTYGAFYFSPLDMAGFTLIGSLSLSLIVGLSPQAVTLFLFASMFLGIFQHTNVRTPRWLGYIVQRPESHTIHHGKGLHRYNYSDLPIFDILFGTFRNPETYQMETGFYPGASARILDMLRFRDVSEPASEFPQAPAVRQSA
jgi:sterol desaturase/sphingolipid hydroxylase (fatty acid hydroxylase superfamily)